MEEGHFEKKESARVKGEGHGDMSTEVEACETIEGCHAGVWSWETLGDISQNGL